MDRFNFDKLLSSQIKRRRLLLGAGTLTGLAIASQWNSKVVASPKFSANPFSLGVASGDPRPNGVTLWTRVLAKG